MVSKRKVKKTRVDEELPRIISKDSSKEIALESISELKNKFIDALSKKHPIIRRRYDNAPSDFVFKAMEYKKCDGVDDYIKFLIKERRAGLLYAILEDDGNIAFFRTIAIDPLIGEQLLTHIDKIKEKINKGDLPKMERGIVIIAPQFYEKKKYEDLLAGRRSIVNGYVSMDDSIMIGLDFNGINLEKITFNDSILVGSDFGDYRKFQNKQEMMKDGRKLRDIKFKRSDLSYSKFNNSILHFCNFLGADLGYVSFNNSKLGQCIFVETSLFRTNFSESFIHQCEFTDINELEGKGCCKLIDFRNARIEDSTFTNVLFRLVSLADTFIIGVNAFTKFKKCVFENVDFTDVKIANVVFEHSLIRYKEFNFREIFTGNAQFKGGWSAAGGGFYRLCDFSFCYGGSFILFISAPFVVAAAGPWVASFGIGFAIYRTLHYGYSCLDGCWRRGWLFWNNYKNKSFGLDEASMIRNCIFNNVLGLTDDIKEKLEKRGVVFTDSEDQVMRLIGQSMISGASYQAGSAIGSGVTSVMKESCKYVGIKVAELGLAALLFP